jgi:tripartite-type tricarboxylate transporter receptor subunit TctC
MNILQTLAKAAMALGLAAMALVLAAMPLGVAAQGKPTLRVLVGFPAGSGADAAARIYADLLANALNANAIVENRSGAGGLLAVHALKQATPESNTFMLTIDHQVVMLPLITNNPRFDVRRDLVPVARILKFNTCLAVSASSPVQNLAQYIEWVRAKPANGKFGVPAAGSQAQFVGFSLFQIRFEPGAV